MATYTPNLNLEKPATSENFNLSKINANWDKIDTSCGQISSKISTSGDDGEFISSMKLSWNSTLGWHLIVTDYSGQVRRIKVDSSDS